MHFGKERKDEVTQRYLAGFTGTEGVLYAGRAQEKATVWRTQRRYHADGSSYAWLVKTSALVNYFYFYCVDADFGPFFIKFCTAMSCPSCRPSSPSPRCWPAAGRIFFEQVIRDNLDIGRPNRSPWSSTGASSAGAKHPQPGRFRTRVITSGVVPSLHIDYKHSKIKRIHKLGRAIRTETTINDAPADFGIPKRLTSLPDLRQIGFTANRRLLGVQTISHDPIPRRAGVLRPDRADRHAQRHHMPHCGSATPASTRCCRPCSSTGCCPAASPTASCAPSSRPSSARPPRTSPPGK